MMVKSTIITMDAVHTGAGTGLAPWSRDWNGDAWVVTLRRSDSAQTYRMDYFTGVGLRKTRGGRTHAVKPAVGDVLECLVSDYQMSDDYSTWADWAIDLGLVDDASPVELAALPGRFDQMRADMARFATWAGPWLDAIICDGPDDGWSSVTGDVTLEREGDA